MILFMQMIEPQLKKSACSYCGDAPVNHFLFYLDGLILNTLDIHAKAVVNNAPLFLKNFADWIPIFLFKTLHSLGLATLSVDIDKANTFRSRIIWQEAKRRGIKNERCCKKYPAVNRKISVDQKLADNDADEADEALQHENVIVAKSSQIARIKKKRI